MGWWGKLLGGTFGFFIGGPLGALLGAALGHNLDRNVERPQSLRGAFRNRQERVQMAFFTATFSVMGHVCKADGRVTRDEIDLARAVMQEMELDEQQRQIAIRLFTRGKEADFPLDEVLAQFRAEIEGRRSLVRMFMEIQLAAAYADGEPRAVERALLHHVADRVGFNRADYDRLEAAVRASRGAGARAEAAASGSGPVTLEQAYAVLGVPAAAEPEEIKRAYRRLLSQHHPDKLVARGLPEEMLKMATQRTREIRGAYEKVRAARGF